MGAHKLEKYQTSEVETEQRNSTHADRTAVCLDLSGSFQLAFSGKFSHFIVPTQEAPVRIVRSICHWAVWWPELHQGCPCSSLLLLDHYSSRGGSSGVLPALRQECSHLDNREKGGGECKCRQFLTLSSRLHVSNSLAYTFCLCVLMVCFQKCHIGPVCVTYIVPVGVVNLVIILINGIHHYPGAGREAGHVEWTTPWNCFLSQGHGRHPANDGERDRMLACGSHTLHTAGKRRL